MSVSLQGRKSEKMPKDQNRYIVIPLVCYLSVSLTAIQNILLFLDRKATKFF